jgi:hypothetical protein
MPFNRWELALRQFGRHHTTACVEAPSADYQGSNSNRKLRFALYESTFIKGTDILPFFAPNAHVRARTLGLEGSFPGM